MTHAPLRVGIVGCGNVALFDHLPFYASRPDLYRITAVADPTAERLDLGRTAAGLPGGGAYASAADMLARDDIDVVDVCTPQNARSAVVLAALGSGRHVICEKPLATVPAAALELIDAATAADRHLAIMHNYLFVPEIAEARRLTRAGEIGDVEVVIANYLGVLDLPGNAAFSPDWRHDAAAAGGGVLVDMLHAVYVAEALLGLPIERVSGWAMARANGAPVEDIASCRFETDTAVALVNIGWGFGPGGIQVSGSRGRLEIRYRDGGTGPFEPLESLLLTRERGATVPVDAPQGDDGLAGILVDFADSIRDGRAPIATAEQGLRVLEATLAVYASAHTGMTIRLPLDRSSALFRRGVAGLADLPGAGWSPLLRRGLFASVTTEKGPA
jgi:predicted dehydrogenase